MKRSVVSLMKPSKTTHRTDIRGTRFGSLCVVATHFLTASSLCRPFWVLVHGLQPSSPSTTISSDTMMRASAAQRYEPFRKHPQLFRGAPFESSWIHADLKSLVDLFASITTTGETTNHTDAPESSAPQTSPPNQPSPGKHEEDQKQDHQVCYDKAMIEKWLRVEAPEVYSFQCFDSSFIRMFNEEIQHFYAIAEQENIPIRRPNSMNNYGVIVNEIGLRPLITAFQQEYLWPLARILFPKQASQFDDHHAFIVRYQAGQDLGLDMHVDDSDVTFNVCMGDDNFTGATLSFCGMFGTPNHRQLVHVYHHVVGRAVLHLGNRRHGADDIESGVRSNLIVWNHNWQWRDKPEYKERRQFHVYQAEQGPPDPTCLSYTHDRDYLAYKDKTSLPPSQRDRTFQGWCPPRGKEYDGFPKGF